MGGTGRRRVAESVTARGGVGWNGTVAKEQGGTGVVLFEVDKESDLPIWVQLRNRLVYLITTGYFKPGEKLPTVRGLAAEISINFNTVNRALYQLGR